MPTTDPQEIADRYVALWNEPDAETRRHLIAELWSPDAVHLLQPPEELRKSATELGFPDAVLEARGHHALEIRVARAHQEFVAPGIYVFRACPDAQRIQNVVKFHWEMLDTTENEVAGGGLEFLILAPSDGRIVSDHQFIGS